MSRSESVKLGFTDAANVTSSAASNASSTIAQSTTSTWDRLTHWASEHKAVVYTIAGVTLVATGAGVYYYSSSGESVKVHPGEPRKSKKERRKQKQEQEKEFEKVAIVQEPTGQ